MSVALVGAGPGGRDLLTLRGAALLAEAEVVVHDRLVDPSVTALAARARLIDVGKSTGAGWSQERICALLVELAHDHDRVVRLKGGDPFLFGRGEEEVTHLRAAGVEVEVVPGVSSALAAPALAGIAVTARGRSSALTVVSAVGQGGEALDPSTFARPGHSLVVLMGVASRQRWSGQLLEAGWDATTAVATVERAGTSDMRVQRATLAGLADLELAAPAVVVVGAVAEERAPSRGPCS